MVKEGYKRTEIGIIPNEWNVKSIEEMVIAPLSYGINAPAVPYDSNLYQYIRITDITESGKYSKENKVSVKTTDGEKYCLKDGDILFARTGASTGKTYIYNQRDGKLVYAGFLIKASINTHDYDPFYVFAQFHTKRYQDWVSIMSMRSGQPGINGKEYSSYIVPVPKFEEQQKIATALSNIDTLIENLEKLIAKKKAIKQGAMQELLTGKRRLPGFNGLWDEITIGELTDVFSGGTPSTANPQYWGGEIPWMSSGELNKKIVSDVQGRITELGLENSSTRMIPAGCVLIGLAGQGKTRGTAAYNTFPLCTNQSIAAIFPNPELFDAKFLYFYMDTKYKELRELSDGGGGRGGLTKKLIEEFCVRIPLDPKEQTAIASILTDMDSEIEQLSNQLGKYKNIKSGMMSELLTGRIRLL